MGFPLNSRIALSIASIAAAAALIVGATFAFFSDTSTSEENTFSTGSADLQIAPDEESPGTYANDISAPAINETGLFPGFEKDYVFWLKNNSSALIGLDLTAEFDNVVTIENADIANQMTVAFTCRTDSDDDGTLDTTFPTSGPSSINAWDAGSGVLGSLAPDDGDEDGSGPDEAECTAHVALPSSLDNTYANSSVKFDGVFTGTQTP